jgi:hypothetical protein
VRRLCLIAPPLTLARSRPALHREARGRGSPAPDRPGLCACPRRAGPVRTRYRPRGRRGWPRRAPRPARSAARR